jgi:hypothetical protein
MISHRLCMAYFVYTVIRPWALGCFYLVGAGKATSVNRCTGVSSGPCFPLCWTLAMEVQESVEV